MEALNSTTILIADCNRQYSATLAKELESTGSVIASQAIDEYYLLPLVESQKPKIVIIDPYFIKEPCRYFIPKLLKSYPYANIIVLSFDIYQDLIDECMNNGAKDFLLKTIGIENLKCSILKICTGEKIIQSTQAA